MKTSLASCRHKPRRARTRTTSRPLCPRPLKEIVRAQRTYARCEDLHAPIDSGKPTRFLVYDEGRLAHRQPTNDALQV